MLKVPIFISNDLDYTLSFFNFLVRVTFLRKVLIGYYATLKAYRKKYELNLIFFFKHQVYCLT